MKTFCQQSTGATRATRTGLLALLMGLIILPGCETARRGFPPTMGIDNFDKVDEKLYRGAQPSVVGLMALSDIGVNTVINLRGADAWQEEELVCRKLGMHYVNIPMNSMAAPSMETIERILLTIGKANGQVFMHCQYGCERTGTAVACYRIRKGESNETALNDAKMHDLSAWATGMREFIRRFK